MLLSQPVLGADVTLVQVTTIVSVLALLGWMDTARLVRGQFLSLLNRDFVIAARALGANGRRIMLVHLIPNSMAPSVMTGVSALRMACLRMTVRSSSPLARAVRT